MAAEDTKISALPAADALTGAELVPIVQGSGLNATTKRTTAQAIANLASGRHPVEAVITSPRNVVEADLNKVFVNPAAVVETVYIPDLAIDYEPGFQITIINLAATGSRFDCGTVGRIYFGDQVSSVGGYIQIPDIGSSIDLVKINSTDWLVCGGVVSNAIVS